MIIWFCFYKLCCLHCYSDFIKMAPFIVSIYIWFYSSNEECSIDCYDACDLLLTTLHCNPFFVYFVLSLFLKVIAA
jgi:hypothetical protein